MPVEYLYIQLSLVIEYRSSLFGAILISDVSWAGMELEHPKENKE